MKIQPVRFAAISVLGMLAPLWWTFSINHLSFGFYALAGSPDTPSTLSRLCLILVPACVVGLSTGVLVAVLSQYRPVVGWLVFVGSLIIGSAVFANSVTSVGELVSSPGTWAFVISVLLGAFAATGANNSFKPKPLRGSA